MSESTGPTTISIPGHVKAGSCGVAFDGVEVKIIEPDEEGNGEVSLNTLGWSVMSRRHRRFYTSFATFNKFTLFRRAPSWAPSVFNIVQKTSNLKTRT